MIASNKLLVLPQTAGYVASFDEETNVIKYIQDRSLYFNKTTGTQRDYIGVTSESSFAAFESSSESVTTDGGFSLRLIRHLLVSQLLLATM